MEMNSSTGGFRSTAKIRRNRSQWAPSLRYLHGYKNTPPKTVVLPSDPENTCYHSYLLLAPSMKLPKFGIY